MERIEEYTIHGVKTPYVDCCINDEQVILKLNTAPDITLNQLEEALNNLRAKVQVPEQMDIFVEYEGGTL